MKGLNSKLNNRLLNKLAEAKELTDVIVKVGNKWKIKGHKVKYWNADYDTKSDAESALRAYWTSKHESKSASSLSFKFEGFSSESGKDMIKSVQHFLITIFGHTLYFDHYTDDSVDLYYKGKPVAELIYKESTEEVIIVPDDDRLDPVCFYDTSEYEIRNYLSDLLLGDLS